MSVPYNGNASNATGTQVTITDPVDGDDLTAASGTLPWNKLADWMQRLADIALNIATTAWTFTQNIVMQGTLAVTGLITGTTLTLSGLYTGTTATLSGLLTGAAATFSGLLTANGGIAHETPLVVGGTGVAFAGSFAAAAQAPRYWKDPVGVVHMDGGVTHPSGVSGGTAFTLPSGYRPTIKQELVAWNVTTQAPCDFIIETNGDVKTTIGAGDSVFFPAPTFPTF